MLFQGNFEQKELACSFQEYNKNLFSSAHTAALQVDGRWQFWVMQTQQKYQGKKRKAWQTHVLSLAAQDWQC